MTPKGMGERVRSAHALLPRACLLEISELHVRCTAAVRCM